MLTVATALRRLLRAAAPLGHENIPVADAVGRVLASDIAARTALPQIDLSAMDGYAIRSKDLGAGARFQLVGTLAAGDATKLQVGRRETVRVLTGAPIPHGADAVVIQENATLSGDHIAFSGTAKPGQFVRRANLDFAVGHRLLASGRRLEPMDIMIAAAGNWAQLPVRLRPRVTIIPTGDELAVPGQRLKRGQVVASSGFGVSAILTKQGALTKLHGPTRDSTGAIRAKLRQAAPRSDLIVTLGGVSVGDRDLISNQIAKHELEVLFHGVSVRPGKPLLAGYYDGTLLVGLPGNPASAIVCTHVFLRPLINRLLGVKPELAARQTATLEVGLPPGGAREHYMRAIVTESNGRAVCRPFGNQDSSIITYLGQANALAIQPAKSPALAAGDPIEYMEI